MKYQNKKWTGEYATLLLALFVIVAVVFLPIETKAATSKDNAAKSSKENSVMALPVSEDGGTVAVGHLRYNYIGNYNYFSDIRDLTEVDVKRNNILKDDGYTNSSRAKLTNTNGADRIIKAYLIWETRKPYKKDDKNSSYVQFSGNDKNLKKIYPEYAFNDNRQWTGWKDDSGNLLNQRRVYCMAADVTSIVQKFGYGYYYVADIPEYHVVNEAAGDNVCSWQLVVIEEGKDFPVRALTLRQGANFRFGSWDFDKDLGYTQKNYNILDTHVTFPGSITSKTSGSVGGQLLIGCQNDHDAEPATTVGSNWDIVELGHIMSVSLYTQKSESGKKTKISNNLRISGMGGGLYNNYSKSAEYGIIVSLQDYSKGLGNSAAIMGAELTDFYWNTFLYIGTAVDIETAAFSCGQKSTVNTAGTVVTIKDTFKNISADKDTGIYNTTARNSVIVVNVDPKLTITGASATGADGKAIAVGNIVIDNNANTVIIKKIKSISKGDTMSYKVTCSVKSGTTFHNSDYISGNLYSAGIKTGMYLDRVAESTSTVNAVPLYNVSLYAGNGIAPGSLDGAGQYPAGQTVTISAKTLTGYRWANWKGTYETANNPYTFIMPAQNVTMTAYGEQGKYTLTLNPNGGTVGVSSVPVAYNSSDSYDLSWNQPQREGYQFLGWYTERDGGRQVYSQNGNCTNEGTYWKDNKWVYPGNATLYAHWKIKYYHVELYAGTGIESVGGAGQYAYGEQVMISASLLPGYHWSEWIGTYHANAQTHTFAMPAQDVNMTAHADANRYTIRFDPNGGEGQIDDIQTAYDQSITLPDGAAVYQKYTLDGVNVTKDVLSGNIRLSSFEEDAEGAESAEEADERPEASRAAGITGESVAGGDETENTDAAEIPGDVARRDVDGESAEIGEDDLLTDEAEERSVRVTGESTEERSVRVTGESTEEADKINMEIDLEEELKAVASSRPYPSVFMGWALEEKKDGFTPQWKTGEELAVSTLVETAGAYNQDGAVIILYAVWDDCPWIQATDLYYTLEQAQSGYITETEILSHAMASDREDGTPILPGFHENGTCFSIPDYQASDFTQFQHDGSCTENLTVVDSVGSVYTKQITVYIADTTPTAVKPEGTTRFISRKYYNASYEKGGLAENSIWKTVPEYRTALLRGFDNMDQDSPIMTFVFSRKILLKMREYVEKHGVGDSREPGALQGFYDQFMAPNRQSH